jgi:hypothetical protein
LLTRVRVKHSGTKLRAVDYRGECVFYIKGRIAI